MYTFTKTGDESDKITVRHEIGNDEVTWPELVENFMYFLQGCGYIFLEEEFEQKVAKIVGEKNDIVEYDASKERKLEGAE